MSKGLFDFVYQQAYIHTVRKIRKWRASSMKWDLSPKILQINAFLCKPMLQAFLAEDLTGELSHRGGGGQVHP